MAEHGGTVAIQRGAQVTQKVPKHHHQVVEQASMAIMPPVRPPIFWKRNRDVQQDQHQCNTTATRPL